MADSNQAAPAQVQAAKVSYVQKLRDTRWLKETAFYPAEYVVMLFTSLGIISSVSMLWGITINYWLSGEAGVMAGTALLGLVASLLVLVPIHLILYCRIRHADAAQLKPFSQHVANGFLGFYIFLIAATVIWLEITIVYDLLRWAFGLEAESKVVLTSVLVLGQAVVWFKLSGWHFLRMRAGAHRPKYYLIALKVVVVAAIVCALLFPSSAGRASARDEIRVGDLASISAAIDTYVSDNNELPGELSDLDDLEADVKKRAKDYEYEVKDDLSEFMYELCARFETDTEQSGISEYSSFTSDYSFAYHGKGRQCFERTSYGGPIYEDYSPESEGLDQLQNSLSPYGPTDYAL